MKQIKSLLTKVSIITALFVTVGIVHAAWTYDSGTKALTDGNWEFTCTEKDGSLTIATYVSGSGDLDFTTVEADTTYPVVSIGGSLFRGIHIAANRTIVTSLALPDTVTSIGSYAFQMNQLLTNVVLSANLDSIASYAFSGCSTLVNVTPFLPDSLTSLPGSAFSECYALRGHLQMINVDPSKASPSFDGIPIESAVIPADWTSIPGSLFRRCSSLRSVTYPGQEAEDGVFYIPPLVTSIGQYAFQGNNQMKTIYLPENLKSIASYGITGSGLERVVPFLPDSLESLAANNFDSKNLTGELRLVNPNFTGMKTCFNNSKITAAYFSPSPVTIANDSFRYCSTISEVYFLGDPPASFGTNVFASRGAKTMQFFVCEKMNETAWAMAVTPLDDPDEVEDSNRPPAAFGTWIVAGKKQWVSKWRSSLLPGQTVVIVR